VAARAPADAAGAAGAVSRFLDALGLPDEVRSSADLAQTPGRVAEAWLDDLVDGYRIDPAAVLADAMPSPVRELVAVTGIEYQSICPHHLLPSRGVAHVGYLPDGKLVGFGQVVRLVDALAHRLILQEDLAHEIAQALVVHLGARGAGCVLDAEHLCLTARGARRTGARAHSEAFAGVLAREGGPRDRFVAAIARAEARPGRRTPKGRPAAGGGRAPARRPARPGRRRR
jgi:GTP cyclohydrolase I